MTTTNKTTARKQEKFYTCEMFLISEDRYVFSGIMTMDTLKIWLSGNMYNFNVDVTTLRDGEQRVFDRDDNKIGIIREYGNFYANGRW